MKKKLNKKGFSLVELIVCIAILAILTSIIAPAVIGNIERTRESKDMQTLDKIAAAIQYALADEAGNLSARNGWLINRDMYVSFDTPAGVPACKDFMNLVKEYLSMDEDEQLLKKTFKFESEAARGGAAYFHIDDNGTVTVVIASYDDHNPKLADAEDKVIERKKSGGKFKVIR